MRAGELMAEPMDEQRLRDEVERRLDRSFARVQQELVELLDLEWEDIEVVVNTSADRHDRSEADVIVELIARAEQPPPVHSRIRKSVIRWIGKPWRERENPWERHKHRIPEPPSTEEQPKDLEEWTPYRPEEHE